MDKDDRGFFNFYTKNHQGRSASNNRDAYDPHQGLSASNHRETMDKDDRGFFNFYTKNHQGRSASNNRDATAKESRGTKSKWAECYSNSECKSGWCNSPYGGILGSCDCKWYDVGNRSKGC